jgi:hypothetical protein
MLSMTTGIGTYRLDVELWLLTKIGFIINVVIFSFLKLNINRPKARLNDGIHF